MSTALVPFVLRQIDGVTVEVQTTALQARDAAVDWAAMLTAVDSPATRDAAVDAQRDLAAIIKGTEAARVAVKAPVLDLGKKIDAAAKEFLGPVIQHQTRLNALVTDYQAEERRKAQEEERKRIEEARRIQAERDRLAAEQRRKEEEARKANLPPPPPATPPPAPVVVVAPPPAPKPAGLVEREVWDFEVLDVDALAAARRDLVTIDARRAEILREIRNGARAIPGLRIFSQLKTEVRL